MSFIFTIAKDPLKMGERDEKYGQAYWCSVAEQLTPVKFNTLEDHQYTVGDKFTCEEKAMRKSAKGTEYEQLKKVKLAGVGNGTQSKEEFVQLANDVVQIVDHENSDDSLKAQRAIYALLQQVDKKLDKLLGNDDQLVPHPTPPLNREAYLDAAEKASPSLSEMYKQQQAEKYGHPPEDMDELEPM